MSHKRSLSPTLLNNVGTNVVYELFLGVKGSPDVKAFLILFFSVPLTPMYNSTARRRHHSNGSQSLSRLLS